MSFTIRNCFRLTTITSTCQKFSQKHLFLNTGNRTITQRINRIMTSSSAGGSEKTFTKEELKQRLTPLQYHVTQEKGTERPFTGSYESNKQKGEYKCIVCGNMLFKSEHKFDSGSGWPSFHQVSNPNAVEQIEDRSHGMKRVEVVCQKCKAHLGHVFNDGPQPTGERFCMNSASLSFEKH